MESIEFTAFVVNLSGTVQQR